MTLPETSFALNPVPAGSGGFCFRCAFLSAPGNPRLRAAGLRGGSAALLRVRLIHVQILRLQQFSIHLRIRPIFQEKNHRTIYDINYEKSLKNNVDSDIHTSDKVRILQKKNQFQKGTEARYSDDVYTVKKVNGKSITLNNDEVYKRTSLLIVPKSTISDEKNVIVKINKQNKEERFLKSEGVEVSNIITTKRNREKTTKTTK